MNKKKPSQEQNRPYENSFFSPSPTCCTWDSALSCDTAQVAPFPTLSERNSQKKDFYDHELNVWHRKSSKTQKSCFSAVTGKQTVSSCSDHGNTSFPKLQQYRFNTWESLLHCGAPFKPELICHAIILCIINVKMCTSVSTLQGFQTGVTPVKVFFSAASVSVSLDVH